METDKILCPWCGAEMVRDGEALVRSDEVAVWMRCMSCGASSPLIKGPQTTNLENLYDMAHAAALRRYTPTLKPMTLEEVRENNEGQMWLELSDPKDAYMQGYCELMMFSLFNGYEQFDFYPCGSDMAYDYRAETYNVKWRCWARRPTDEERSAAEWKN